MLDSQARIVEPRRPIGLTSGDAGDGDRAVSFEFRVQWSTLFVALESAKSTVPAVAFHEPDGPLADARGYKPAIAPRVSEGTGGSGSTVQWEMVIPKMARPSSRIPAVTESAPPPVPRP